MAGSRFQMGTDIEALKHDVRLLSDEIGIVNARLEDHDRALTSLLEHLQPIAQAIKEGKLCLPSPGPSDTESSTE